MYDYNCNRIRHEDCAYKNKRQTSIESYAKKSLRADPYWLNEKILRELFSAFGPNTEIEPELLEEKGFNFSLFKSKLTDQGIIIFIMNKFGFSLLKNQKVIICRIN